MTLRIGLEIFGTQSESRDRGIGRYCRNLVSALAVRTEGTGHELVLFAEEGKPLDVVPTGPHVSLRLIEAAPTMRDSMARVVQSNRDALDALVFVNPLELVPGFDIPTRPSGGAPKLAAVVHDFIPLIFQDAYFPRWATPEFIRRYHWSLERLRTYDVLLANSEATRIDAIRFVNIEPERIVTIGAAGLDREQPFSPDPDNADDLARIRSLGLTGPFVFALSASDPRKNLRGTVEAFAALPASLRAQYQLALTARLSSAETEALHDLAHQFGLSDSALVLAGHVDDATLRALYRRCAAFVFPSFYEGFGLPIVEAMACGAAVIAGANSSQTEAAGDAALLVDVADTAAIASALARVLTDRGLAQSLRAKALPQAQRFSWDRVAEKVLAALESTLTARNLMPHRSSGPYSRSEPLAGPGNWRIHRRPIRSQARPRIALFSPMHPAVAEYAESLLPALSELYRIDLFHEHRARPLVRFRARGMGCHDHRLFDRFDRLRPFDAVVYLFADVPVDRFVFECLMKRPGIVDFRGLVPTFQNSEAAARRGQRLRPSLGEPLLSDDQASAPALDCIWHAMDQPVVGQVEAAIVHSQAAADRLGKLFPPVRQKTFVVPLPVESDESSGRAAIAAYAAVIDRITAVDAKPTRRGPHRPRTVPDRERGMPW